MGVLKPVLTQEQGIVINHIIGVCMPTRFVRLRIATNRVMRKTFAKNITGLTIELVPMKRGAPQINVFGVVNGNQDMEWCVISANSATSKKENE